MVSFSCSLFAGWAPFASVSSFSVCSGRGALAPGVARRSSVAGRVSLPGLLGSSVSLALARALARSGPGSAGVAVAGAGSGAGRCAAGGRGLGVAVPAWARCSGAGRWVAVREAVCLGRGARGAFFAGSRAVPRRGRVRLRFAGSAQAVC
uniref:Secreted protein n=1 Tax=Knipowitschia caucasica TaxID=637954 RepID=A0AAV2M1W9_KNICA